MAQPPTAVLLFAYFRKRAIKPPASELKPSNPSKGSGDAVCGSAPVFWPGVAWADSVPWALSVAEVPAGAAGAVAWAAEDVAPASGAAAWPADGAAPASVCPLGLAVCAELSLAVGAFIDDGLLCEVLAD